MVHCYRHSHPAHEAPVQLSPLSWCTGTDIPTPLMVYGCRQSHTLHDAREQIFPPFLWCTDTNIPIHLIVHRYRYSHHLKTHWYRYPTPIKVHRFRHLHSTRGALVQILLPFSRCTGTGTPTPHRVHWNKHSHPSHDALVQTFSPLS